MNRKAQRRDGGAACSLCLSPAAASCLSLTPRLGDDRSALIAWIAWIVINKIGERRGLQVREGTGRGRRGGGGIEAKSKEESEGPERGEWEAVTRRPRAAKIAPDMIAGQK